MSGPTLDDALDAMDGPGVIDVVEEGGRTQVDAREVGPLGVRVRGLTVGRSERDVGREAEDLPGRLRAIPERVVPVEVDKKLGGAILRTAPDQMRRGRFFEFDVRADHTEIRRYKVHDGERGREDFTLTRDQLRDLIDEVRGSTS